jgi:pyruvate/2-oxoglutarate dehydrogenase complex dihydrolipoamide acyltransferase (E2) component
VATGYVGARRPRFRVERISAERRMVIDVVRLAAGQSTIHGLIEVDVTGLRRALRDQPRRPTVTGFAISVLGQAVSECPKVNVRHAGRHIVYFNEVDVVVTMERKLDDDVVPLPVVVMDAAAKSPAEVTAELRAARDRAVSEPVDTRGTNSLRRLPPVVRRWGARSLSRMPAAAARFGPPIGVTSLGMIGPGWGIPLSPVTVMVTIGGLTRRVVLLDGAVTEREFLPLTLSFDHTVIDGAPAARFTQTLRHLLESSAAAATSPAKRPASAAHLEMRAP